MTHNAGERKILGIQFCLSCAFNGKWRDTTDELQTNVIFSVGHVYAFEVLTLYLTGIFTARDGAGMQNQELNKGLHLAFNKNTMFALTSSHFLPFLTYTSSAVNSVSY